MGFQALFVREDVLTILKDTLHKYYSSTHEGEVYVGYEPKKGAARFDLNPRIGFICQPFPSKEVRSYLYKSYDIRNNVLKRLIAKFFVFVSTHTKGLFTLKESLYIYPANLVNSQTLISYLNRSIRIFNFNDGTTVSIQKESFTRKFFDNQLQFRLTHEYDFIPAIVDHSDFWFKEYILDGKPLARITDEDKFQEELKKVQQYMSKIQKKTLRYVDADEYVGKVGEQCGLLLEQSKAKKGIETYDQSSNYLKQLFGLFGSKELKIPVSETHGDLQAGNGWVSDSQTWIIDWETHAERSVWFDAMTLVYGTRYYGGIKKLVEDSCNQEARSKMLQGFECELPFKEMIIIYLLEDLYFNLEDMVELPNSGGRDSFDAYMRDIIPIDLAKHLSVR